MKKFIAHDIEWNVEIEEIYAVLDKMAFRKAAEALEITAEKYANMTTEERHDYAYDVFHHNRIDAAEFVGLPDEVRIPDYLGITSEKDDMENVTDWLSDEYGYFINNYKVRQI